MRISWPYLSRSSPRPWYLLQLPVFLYRSTCYNIACENHDLLRRFLFSVDSRFYFAYSLICMWDTYRQMEPCNYLYWKCLNEEYILWNRHTERRNPTTIYIDNVSMWSALLCWTDIRTDGTQQLFILIMSQCGVHYCVGHQMSPHGAGDHWPLTLAHQLLTISAMSQIPSVSAHNNCQVQSSNLLTSNILTFVSWGTLQPLREQPTIRIKWVNFWDD